MKRVAALAWFLSLTACNLFDHKTVLPTLHKTFVHGDPAALIAGAQADTQHFITAQSLDSFRGFVFVGGESFLRSSETHKGPVTRESLEKENAPSSKMVGLKDLPRYAFLRDGKSVKLKSESENLANTEKLELDFEIDATDTLQVVRWNNAPVTAVHYSISPDGQAFSILMKIKTENTDGLLSVNFVKPELQTHQMRRTERTHQYLLGAGLPALWDTEITPSLCGTPSDTEKTLLRNGILSWSDQGNIGSLPLKIEEPTTFPPFSDLNTHCVQFASSYLFEDTHEARVWGISLPVVNPFQQKIVGGSVFISKQAITESRGTLAPQTTLAIVRHEFGHFLGLGHQFERDHGITKYPSIMGYDGEENITSFDRQSIELAYGSYPSATQTPEQNEKKKTEVWGEDIPHFELCKTSSAPCKNKESKPAAR